MKLRRSKSMRLPKKPSQENVISTTTSNGIPLLMASDPLLPSTPVLLSQPNLSFMETEVGVQPTKKNKRKSAEDFSMSEVIEIKKRREVEEVDTMEVVVENGKSHPFILFTRFFEFPKKRRNSFIALQVQNLSVRIVRIR